MRRYWAKEKIFTSPPQGAEPGWEWQNVNVKGFRPNRARARVMRDYFHDQRMGYLFSFNSRMLDLKESRIGMQLADTRIIGRVKAFTHRFNSLLDQMDKEERIFQEWEEVQNNATPDS